MTTTWIGAFLLTHLIEIPCYTLLSRPHWARGAVSGLLGTSLTHPLLWFVGPRIAPDYTTLLVAGELAVTGIELVVFRVVVGLPWWRAAVAAVVANGCSLAIGLGLRALGW